MTPKEEARAKQVLLDAADLIEKHGWTRWAWKLHGRRCVLCAVYEASGLGSSASMSTAEWERVVLSSSAVTVLKTYIDDNGDDVILWNGHASRKIVLSTLRQAGGGEQHG